MTLLLGLAAAAGVLLAASPWLWPAGGARRRPPRRSPLTEALAAAGLAGLAPGWAILLDVAAALASAAIVWLLSAVPGLAIAAGAAGAVWPVLWLRGRRRRLIAQRRALWPDLCDLLVGSIRAGLSLPDALAALAGSSPQAIRPAFAAFASDLDASGHFESALDRLKATLADPIGDRVLETLRMARQVGGGELGAVLRALSTSIRAEATLRAEIDSRQSWTRGAAVLGAGAPWLILLLLTLRPEGQAAYATPEGASLILGGAAVSAVAFRVMVRIGRLPEPRRWFG